MDSNILRQIKDIQFRAERLINGKATLSEIREFNQYNEELKEYLLINLKDPEIVERVKLIPVVLEESKSQALARSTLATFLMFFAAPFVNYLQNRQRIEFAIENIRESRGKYASIEFLTKSMQQETANSSRIN